MKLTVLMENTSRNEWLAAEHGLCLYIETAHHRLLADTGASELTWKNADLLGVDVENIDTVIISHGHYDHAGGLLSFSERNKRAEIFMRRTAGGCFMHGEKYIGIDPQIFTLPHLHLLDADAEEIDAEMFLFSGISGKRLTPDSNRALTQKTETGEIQDSFDHEQCLVLRENGRCVLVSGCAHNGILNILDRYHELFDSYPDAVFTGFHMMKKNGYTEDDLRNIRETASALSELPTEFYSGHCTGDEPFSLMKERMENKLHEIHVGDSFQI